MEAVALAELDRSVSECHQGTPTKDGICLVHAIVLVMFHEISFILFNKAVIIYLENTNVS